MSKEYCVYKLACIQNGKVYIGVTSQDPSLRWRGGKAYHGDLKADIDLYGWETGFDREILESGLSYSEAALAEKRYIAFYAKMMHLYNATAGGEVLPDEVIAEKARRQKGKKLAPTTRRKISEARQGMVFSDQHHQRLSEAHKGKPGFWTGKKRKAETVQKISKKLSIPIRCVETGEVYANLKDASEKTGYPMSCISKWCNGVRPKKCTYTFERMN